ncbi:MAG: MBL fold metallo-hydrolase [Clostridiales bacterium]|nr:MBL fold metallo-hydrolase [Clostridiales bacterium]
MKLIKVGIFWAVPDKYEGGWNFYEVVKSYELSAANSLGFIDYPYSHYEKWDDVRSANETPDCYHYPRGRVLYDTKQNKHRIFADECLDEYDLQEIVELFEIEDFELCRDEHYVSSFTKKHKQKVDMPVLTYNVLRGKDKIGENLIEISYGDTKILVELGKALDGGDELSDIEKSVLETPYNAVIVSHYHADHAGLIEFKKDCPIYIGSGAYRILAAMNEYRGQAFAGNITTYQNGRAFTVGGIRITPFLCDHSAFDSYMLLFEAGGKSILYTGDFRFHGRKEKEQLLARLPKKVSTLICEGTNVQTGKPCFSESVLEDTLVGIMRQSEKPLFVLQSATNIDRLVSVYRAAKRSGRILYEDNYAALIATAAGGKIPRPDVFKDVFAFTPRVLYGRRKDMFFEFENKRGLRQIPKKTNFVMLVRPSMLEYVKKLAERMDLSRAVLIYSMWIGYKERPEMAEFLTEVEKMGIKIKTLHTSGHASADDIELLKQTVSADEYVTVHTSATTENE